MLGQRRHLDVRPIRAGTFARKTIRRTSRQTSGGFGLHALGVRSAHGSWCCRLRVYVEFLLLLCLTSRRHTVFTAAPLVVWSDIVLDDPVTSRNSSSSGHKLMLGSSLSAALIGCASSLRLRFRPGLSHQYHRTITISPGSTTFHHRWPFLSYEC